jgi:hypothetical protein
MQAIQLHEFGPRSLAGYLVSQAHADLEGRRALAKVVLEPAMKSMVVVGPHRQTDLEETA